MNFFRYGTWKDGKATGPWDVYSNFTRLGLPLKVPLYPLADIIPWRTRTASVLRQKPLGHHYTFIKIDTDSIDCDILRYFVDLTQRGVLTFTAATLEMSGFCATSQGLVEQRRLFADLQGLGYHLYRADAHYLQKDGLAADFDRHPTLTQEVTHLPSAAILRFKNMSHEAWNRIDISHVMNPPTTYGYHLLATKVDISKRLQTKVMQSLRSN